MCALRWYIARFPKIYYISIFNPYGCNSNHAAAQYSTFRSRDQNQNNSGFDDAKAKIILKLNFKTPDDALPFYKLPIKSLLHIYKTTKNDEEQNFCKNRLYFISDCIKVPPAILSTRLAKRTFVYSLSFDWIQRSLDVLLEMKVPGERILRDLWVLKYHHETIRERLQRVKDLGIEKLYPWMVRCDEDILKRSIEITCQTKDILGDVYSTRTYLAERLNTSVENVDRICNTILYLRNIRVTKVKNFIDFLEKEGFEVADIASKPRILCSSIKTVQQRLEILRNLGVQDINLNVLCRSRKHFDKYCESLDLSQKKT